ncbi:MAG TPA: xylose isomerase, partial [Paraburkholderia sp.]|nr:xylose isomerase [Paraburkholderia sp.]
NFKRMVDYLGERQQASGVKLLWGTANLFSNPRYAGGAATNPNPEVFAYAATQVCHALDATRKLGGENYVLWGGREGYDTLLNTDLKREREQFARFLSMVVEHKHRTGFTGTLLIEPKPQEPTKHQYDYDVATVHGFLTQYGLQNEIRVNIEANHATLAGHSFHHEIATAFALGVFGSVDANRGDPQNGWDTDQFPNSVEELTLAFYEILRHGGFTTGGMNFDAKVRRASADPEDLFYGHVGAIDVLALALERGAALVENDRLEQFRSLRYAGWDSEFGRKILAGGYSLSSLATDALAHGMNPQHASGQQERLENVVNQAIYGQR